MSRITFPAHGDFGNYISLKIEMWLHFSLFDIIIKLANALQVEIKDFFEFAHEAKNTRELKEIISNLLKEVDDERLRLAVKVLRALVR